jgi:hypothetical protein
MQLFGKWLVLLVATALLGSCSSTPEQELSLEEKLAARGYTLGEEIQSIRGWNLNGWTYVDDYHFIMKSGVRDRYLISLRTRSINLRSAVFLGFSKTAGSLTNVDRVVLRDAGGRTERILIDTMYVLEGTKAVQEEEGPEKQ